MKTEWDRQGAGDPLGDLFIVIAEWLRRSGAIMPEKRGGGLTEEECGRALDRMRAAFDDRALSREERARRVMAVMRELMARTRPCFKHDNTS